MEHLKNIFERISNEPFPSVRGQKIKGVDLVMIDSDTRRLAEKFISRKGVLSADEIKILDICYSDLKLIVPELQKFERQYFASLRQLAGEILAISKGKKTTDSEIKKRDGWKLVYPKIKVIVNELDPLGVADMVDDEYDDLNFKIYSTLLTSKDEKKIFKIIKNELINYYSVTIPDDAILKATAELVKIET